MTISSPDGVPYHLKAASMPPTYLDNIPMTATRQFLPDVHDEAMPYRPRERPMEKAFRQLCCGSCWGFCAWIAGIVVLLAGIIVVAVVLVSNSRHSAPVLVPLSSSASPAQASSPTIYSPVTSFITTTILSQQPSISISISTVSPLQPSIVTDTASQTSTSTVTTTQTSTTTSIVSPPQTRAVARSLSGSLTTITTTSVSTASADSSSSSSSHSRLTSLIHTINAPPKARRPLSPPCFVNYLNDVAPGLYTRQSWTTVGTYEVFSTAGGVPTRDALMTYTGVELGVTTTVWPLCGQYTLSAYSTAPTAAPPPTAPKVTRTSVIVVPAPTTTVLPLQRQHTFLPTPSRAQLAISPRRPADAVPSASERPSKPAITTSASHQAVPTPSTAPGPTTRTDKITYPPHHTTAPSIPRTPVPEQTAGRSLAPATLPPPPAEHAFMRRPKKNGLSPGMIVAIVLGSLIVVTAAIGMATRWFRHGHL